MIAKIAYFVHDLADPAVHRRIRMLKVGGAAVVPIGFRRGAKPITAIDGISTIEIGRTADFEAVQTSAVCCRCFAKAQGHGGALARV